MPRVIYAPAAIWDLERLRSFLRDKNPAAAQRAGETIRKGVTLLGIQPGIGRLVEDLPEDFRDWIIDFGDSGYVVRYHLGEDEVTILAIRHQKEAGYS